jgi:hypothetical protein
MSDVRRQFVYELLPRLYAYHGFYYYFNDKASVMSGFLAPLSAQDRETVYSDPDYGLSKPSTLWYWFRGSLNPNDAVSLYYKEQIFSHFLYKGVKITQKMIDGMIGSKSIIAMIS